MATAERIAELVRFGAFELDLREGMLTRGGLKIHLQHQPFLVLAHLVAHAGELVTREELKESIWHADTFVNAEQGLNTAIRKIRDALGDPSGKSLYVETVPRHGYRFVAPVAVLRYRDSESGTAVPAADRAPASLDRISASRDASPKPFPRRRYWTLAAVVVLLALLFTALNLVLFRYVLFPR